MSRAGPHKQADEIRPGGWTHAAQNANGVHAVFV
jgi:hypothetical protein